MEILRITTADIRDGAYIKSAVDVDGHVELDPSLGWVMFASIRVKGHIWVGDDTGIMASDRIEVGEGISGGLGVRADPNSVTGTHLDYNLCRRCGGHIADDIDADICGSCADDLRGDNNYYDET